MPAELKLKNGANPEELREPKDMFLRLCDQGAKIPMTEEEIDAIISDFRKSHESGSRDYT